MLIKNTPDMDMVHKKSVLWYLIRVADWKWCYKGCLESVLPLDIRTKKLKECNLFYSHLVLARAKSRWWHEFIFGLKTYFNKMNCKSRKDQSHMHTSERKSDLSLWAIIIYSNCIPNCSVSNSSVPLLLFCDYWKNVLRLFRLCSHELIPTI